VIVEIRNGLHVKRFHTTFRTQEETVGHHSANVASIILRLDPECSRELLIAALMHDVAEVYTGDVPAPFKWDNPHIKSGLDKGEQDYRINNNIQNPTLTIEERQLLKLADMLDLVLSSLEECGRGNASAWELVLNGSDYIGKMGLSNELLQECDTMVTEVKKQWRLMTSK